MTQSDALIWLGWILCLGLSFVLSGMEAGVFALNRVRLRQQARSGQKTAVRLMKFLRDPEQFLWTLFIGLFFFCTIGAIFLPQLGIYGYIADYGIGPSSQWWEAPFSRFGIRYSFTLAAATGLGMPRAGGISGISGCVPGYFTCPIK